MSYYRTQLEDWLSDLEIDCKTCFDIGGKQLPVKDRLKSFKANRYIILDIPDYDIELDLKHSLHLIHPVPAHADVIFCLEVFEYLINPLQALKNISRLLLDDGVAYISIPLVYPVHNETELDSLRYTENGFKRMCKEAGLTAEVVKYRRDQSGKLVEFYMADGMHPAKGIEHNVSGYIMEVRHDSYND